MKPSELHINTQQNKRTTAGFVNLDFVSLCGQPRVLTGECPERHLQVGCEESAYPKVYKVHCSTKYTSKGWQDQSRLGRVQCSLWKHSLLAQPVRKQRYDSAAEACGLTAAS